MEVITCLKPRGFNIFFRLIYKTAVFTRSRRSLDFFSTRVLQMEEEPSFSIYKKMASAACINFQNDMPIKNTTWGGAEAAGFAG